MKKQALAAIALVGALLVGGVIALVTASGGDSVESAPTTSRATTTTSATVFESAETTSSTTSSTTTTTTTTTTSSTTTSSTTTTTTTTVAPATTLVEAGVPVWPPYELLPPLDGVAALTGTPADENVTTRPVVAAKVDNFRSARPQWGLDQADVIIEENVEGVTRFVALFHSRYPGEVGPIRSARTGDLDLFATLNRPVLVWSGGNSGVTRWIESAAESEVLVDFTALENRCYRRFSGRSAPHNLLNDPACAVENSPTAGPASPMWAIDGRWAPPDDFVTAPDSTFPVTMDGVRVEWTWDDEARLYRRSQDGRPHVTQSGSQISVNNVVELFVFHAASPVDARSPNPVTVGRGGAIIHRDGVAIEGIWARQTAYDPFTFADAATGEWITLDVGTTFVELVRDRPA